MGLMDAINADARVELKVGDLYSVLNTAAENGRTAKFLINAINCEVPYRYIREMLTGEKETTEDGDDPVVMTAEIEIRASEVAAAIKRTVLQEAGDKVKQRETDLPFPDAGDLKDCAPEGVSCEQCDGCPNDQEPFFVTPEIERYEELKKKRYIDLVDYAEEKGITLRGSTLEEVAREIAKAETEGGKE